MSFDPANIAALVQNVSFEGISEMVAAGTKLAAQAGSFLIDNFESAISGITGGVETPDTQAAASVPTLSGQGKWFGLK
jgi:hypothetical protein